MNLLISKLLSRQPKTENCVTPKQFLVVQGNQAFVVVKLCPSNNIQWNWNEDPVENIVLLL